jgi:hypothetical protein
MFLMARAFVSARSGRDDWARLVEGIDTGNELPGLVPLGWYPETLFVQMLHELGRDDAAAVRQLAAYEAEQDLTVIHRMFLRLANPAYVLEKAGDYWSRFHDSGTWSVERLGASGARGTLQHWGIADSVACEYLGTYVHRMFELVGARDVKVAHPSCRAAGAAHCVFEGSWG